MLAPVFFDLFYDDKYVVQTGSGDLHLFFKLGDDFGEGCVLRQKVKCTTFNNYFKNPGDGEVDILLEQVIVHVEGSSYSFDGVTLKYFALKPGSTIADVDFNDIAWKAACMEALVTPQVKQQAVSGATSRPMGLEELATHLENIPNTTRNWQEWYTMAQTVYNVAGNEPGYYLFRAWSSKCDAHDDRELDKLWLGLKQRNDGSARGMGPILYMSRQANIVTEENAGETAAHSQLLGYLCHHCLHVIINIRTVALRADVPRHQPRGCMCSPVGSTFVS